MRHLRLFRAMLGGAGLVGCIGLLAGQARADIIEFVPVRSAYEPAAASAKTPPVAPSLPGAAAASVKSAPCSPERRADSRSANGRRADCAGQRVAMAPVKDRAPH